MVTTYKPISVPLHVYTSLRKTRSSTSWKTVKSLTAAVCCNSCSGNLLLKFIIKESLWWSSGHSLLSPPKEFCFLEMLNQYQACTYFNAYLSVILNRVIKFNNFSNFKNIFATFVTCRLLMPAAWVSVDVPWQAFKTNITPFCICFR